MPEDHPYIQYEFRATKEQVEAEKLVRGDVGLWGLTKDLVKSRGHRTRVLLGIGLIFFKTFSGVQAVNYYSPIIFEQLGFTGTKNSLFATGVCLFIPWKELILTFSADLRHLQIRLHPRFWPVHRRPSRSPHSPHGRFGGPVSLPLLHRRLPHRYRTS